MIRNEPINYSSKPRGRALDAIVVTPSSPNSSTTNTNTSCSDFSVSFTQTYKDSSFSNLFHTPITSGGGTTTNHTTTSTAHHLADKLCAGFTACYDTNVVSATADDNNNINYDDSSSSASKLALAAVEGWKVEVYINNYGPIQDLEMRYLGTKKDQKRRKRRHHHRRRASSPSKPQQPRQNEEMENEEQQEEQAEEERCCIFVNTLTTKPPCSVLNTLLSQQRDNNNILHSGQNEISYILYAPTISSPIAYAKANLYIWSSSDSIICSDIDGTITKSDLTGIWDTILFQNYKESSAHRGVCQLYSELVKKKKEQMRRELNYKEEQQQQGQQGGQLRFVYLTSRPIALIEKTKSYLSTLTQNQRALPQGPIFCYCGHVSEVLWTELVKKNTYEFKADILRMQVLRPFLDAGRLPNETLFLAGFGNKKTDAIAYDMAGISRHNIYIIDKESCISCLDNGFDDDDGDNGGGEEEEDSLMMAAALCGSCGTAGIAGGGGDGDTNTDNKVFETEETTMILSSSAPPSPSKMRRGNYVDCCIVDVSSNINQSIKEEKKTEEEEEDYDDVSACRNGMEAPRSVSMRGVIEAEGEIRQRPQRNGKTTHNNENAQTTTTTTTTTTKEKEHIVDTNTTATTSTKKKQFKKKKMASYEKYTGTTYRGYDDPKLIVDVHEKMMKNDIV